MVKDATSIQTHRAAARGSRSSKAIWPWLAIMVILTPPILANALPALPYEPDPIRIDGQLNDWKEPTLERAFAETELPAVQANQVRVRLAWNTEDLLIAGEVSDQEWHLAPSEAQVDQFHHYDSLQIYLDPRADSVTRMNGDDIDLLLLPDGRFGLLRGDDLVAELAAAQVPQRESAPLAVRYASQRRGDRWQFELAIPFAGLGIQAQDARALKLDVAMNDWLTAQPLAPGAAISRAALLGQEAAPPNPAPTVGRDLWPLTWTGQRDFGYPQYWQNLQLRGGPDWLERLARQLGIERFVLAMTAVSVLLIALAAGIVHWRSRRHLRALIARLGDISAAPVPRPIPVPVVSPDAVDPVAPITPELPPSGDIRVDGLLARVESEPEPEPALTEPPPPNRDRQFAERVAEHIRRHISEDLSPQSLADALHVSLRTLQRHLREGLDTSPQELLLAIRLETAAERLRDPNRRIQEVAFDLGFQDLSHFSRRFRAAYGCTPSAYQQRGATGLRPN